MPCGSFAADVTLAWDPNTEAELAGYSLHYGLASGSYTDQVGLATIGKSTTWTVTGLPEGTRHYFAVRAHDTRGNQSGFSNEVSYPEAVSKPLPPSGPTSLQANVSYVFTAGGAASSTGEAVEYRFFWSDGTDSGWLPAGTIEATKGWEVPASYTEVRVQARCAAHTTVVSELSDPITVHVETAPSEILARPATPSGPTTVAALVPRAFSTGSSTSSLAHPVEYRFLWGDGTVSPWLSAGEFSLEKAWTFAGTYSVRAEARCALHPTVHSSPSNILPVHVESAGVESLTPPAAPAGPGSARTGSVYGFATGNAVSTGGDPIQYRFQWGDGTATGWLTPGAAGTATAWKSWPAAGVYSVVAEARCALHTGLSSVSEVAAVSVTGGGPQLISDSFSDGTAAGDPQWRTLSGKWVVGADKTFTSAGRKAINRAVVNALPAFKAGRIAAKVKLSKGSLLKSTGVVFALADTRHYRYVAVSKSRVVLGQVGGTRLEKAGVKAVATRAFRAGQWYRIRVDVHPDGRVRVFLGNSTKPAVSYRFADQVAGRIGLVAHQSVASFDDFRAWDARALR